MSVDFGYPGAAWGRTPSRGESRAPRVDVFWPDEARRQLLAGDDAEGWSPEL